VPFFANATRRVQLQVNLKQNQKEIQ